MRKRIVIALLAIVGIAVLAFVLTQPKKGTVKYHKTKYLEAWDRMNGMDWKGRMGDWLGRRIGISPPIFYATRNKRRLLAQEVASHRDALVQLGYLTEKWVAFSNRAVPRMSMLTNWPTEEDPRLVDFFFSRSGDQTNTILVIAPSSSIKAWEDYFAKYDVPENGN